MDKFLTYLGGIIGGYTLIETPVENTVMSSLNATFDIIGSLAMILFAGAFIVNGVRWLLRK